MKNSIEQNEVRELTKKYLQEVKLTRPTYSIRAFARRLEISPALLSGFLSEKIRVSSKVLAKIVEIAEPNPNRRKEILAVYNSKLLSKMKEEFVSTNYDYRLLNEEEMLIIKDWYHYGILFLTETKDFQFDIFWIAKRLGISPDLVEEAIERLLRLKLIEVDDQKNIRILQKNVKTPDDLASRALREMHKQMLDKASVALEEIPVELRDITSVTLPVNMNHLPKAKELIRKFQDDLMALLETDEMSEVYNVMIAMQPLSKSVAVAR